MNILFLAPQPFFQNRGTPIAVDLLVQALCDEGHTVDLLVFAQGEDREHENLTLLRAGKRLGFTRIPPGFSLKKIVLDVAMLWQVIGLLRKNRYDVIHAVEEAAFIAWLVTRFKKLPFIYDMDSSLATQLTDRFPRVAGARPVLRWLESVPIKQSLMVIPVCDALASLSSRYRSEGVHLLKDVSLIEKSGEPNLSEEQDTLLPLFETLFNSPRRFLLYVGNLESYQGIDLMIESHALAVRQNPDIALIIVGGSEADIDTYSKKTEALGLTDTVRFLGPKPVSLLYGLCSQAQLLLSPRIHGENTPMKLYSYLDTGVPVLATDLSTHTEVISPSIGYVAAPDPVSFSTAIDTILNDYEQARARSAAAVDYIEKNHSRHAFTQRVKAIYDQVEDALETRHR